MAKMWAGRFLKEADAKLDSFNTSLPFDCRLYKEDIEGSLAHSEMLQRQGIISKPDKEAIQKGLNSILSDIENSIIDFSGNYEDIHMFIEKTLTDRIGDAGKRLHTARSRNDQIALDMRLYVKKEIKEIQKLIISFLETLCKNAAEHKETIMPGFTHLQHAQPISLAHWMMAYANMLKRDYIRLENTYELMDECPLGSGALATTTYPIDREYTSRLLNFKKPVDNSLDGVSDRDYCIELASDLSILMMHLSRMSEEIIQWSTIEFHFLELDDAYSTGSSIM
ncbi:MAG: argininosuccinate lyase, partial [Erysipelotrichaceae bacterium]